MNNLHNITLALAKKQARSIDALIFSVLPSWAQKIHASKRIPRRIKLFLLRQISKWYEVEIRSYWDSGREFSHKVYVYVRGKEVGSVSTRTSAEDQAIAAAQPLVIGPHNIEQIFNQVRRHSIASSLENLSITKCSRCPRIMSNQPAAMIMTEKGPEPVCEECVKTLAPLF